MENFFLMMGFMRFMPPELVDLISSVQLTGEGTRQYFYANSKTGQSFHDDVYESPQGSMSIVGGFMGNPMTNLGVEVRARRQYLTSMMLGNVKVSDAIRDRINTEYPPEKFDGVPFSHKLYPAYMLSEMTRDTPDEQELPFKKLLTDNVLPHMYGEFSGVMVGVSPSRTYVVAMDRNYGLGGDSVALQVSYLLINGVHCVLIAPTSTTTKLVSELRKFKKHEHHNPDGPVRVLFRHHIIHLRNRVMILNPIFINGAFINKTKEHQDEGSSIAALSDMEDRLNSSLIQLRIGEEEMAAARAAHRAATKMERPAHAGTGEPHKKRRRKKKNKGGEQKPQPPPPPPKRVIREDAPLFKRKEKPPVHYETSGPTVKNNIVLPIPATQDQGVSE